MRAIVVCAVIAGCSFPTPEIIDLEQDSSTADTGAAVDSAKSETTGDTTVGDSTMSETSADSSMVDGDAPADTAAVDSADAADTKMDTGGDTILACETGDPCDCDGDGDKKPGAGCGGGDCDDGDKRRNSKVVDFQSYSIAGVTHGGDWNCNTIVEREFGNGGLNCGGLAIGPCAGTKGYKESMPTCGGMATLVTCKVSGGVLCVEDTSMTVPVKCK